MHDLDFTKGVAAIAYTGETPWHGYGKQKDPGRSLEEWRVDAGLDYEVLERPVVWNPYLTFDNVGAASDQGFVLPERATEFTNHKLISGKKLLVRSDTLDPLSIVGTNYKIVQPKAVLEFFRDLIDELGFEMHVAGALADGNRVWALAKVGKNFSLAGDRVEGYLLLATSYDGKFSTTLQFTSIRVVCNNTLTWSLDRGQDQGTGIVRIPHMTEFDPVKVKQEIGLLEQLSGEGWEQFQTNVEKLADVKITKRQAVEFFLELLGVTEEEAAEGKQILNTKKLLAFYESGPGSDFITAKNTTWGLVNAVTFFTDHGRRAHNNGTRFNSAAFGAGAKLKTKAFNKALDLADAA